MSDSPAPVPGRPAPAPAVPARPAHASRPGTQQAPARPAPQRRPVTAGLVVSYAVVLGLGIVVGTVGTVMHRLWAPWILLVVLLTVAVAGVMVRAWVGAAGLIAYGVGWLAAVQLLVTSGPGGNVLVPDGSYLSYAWMAGGMVMIGVAAFAPRRWFVG